MQSIVPSAVPHNYILNPQIIHCNPEHLSPQGVDTVFTLFYQVNMQSKKIAIGA